MCMLLSTWRQSWISFHLHGADGRDKGGAAEWGNGQGHFVAAISERNGNELELAFLKAAHANLRLWMGRTAKGKVWELGKDFWVWHSTDPLNFHIFSLVYVVTGLWLFLCVCFSKSWIPQSDPKSEIGKGLKRKLVLAWFHKDHGVLKVLFLFSCGKLCGKFKFNPW